MFPRDEAGAGFAAGAAFAFATPDFGFALAAWQRAVASVPKQASLVSFSLQTS